MVIFSLFRGLHVLCHMLRRLEPQTTISTSDKHEHSQHPSLQAGLYRLFPVVRPSHRPTLSSVLRRTHGQKAMRWRCLHCYK